MMRPAGVLLDMDGTLTVPRLDFPAIKADLGIGDQPILEAMAAMSHDQRRVASAKLDRHEADAAAASELAVGCHDLLDWLAAERLPFAVITRNSRQSVETVWRLHGLPACVTVAREDATFKPDPAPLRLAADRLGVEVADCWMVGDGVHDVEAAAAAGCRSVWLSLGREQRPFGAVPWRTVRDLPGLLDALRDSGSRRT